MKVVVTGGAGFIGSNLVRHLAGLPQITEVIAFDDLSGGRAENVEGVDKATLVVGSILDRALLDDVLVGANTVVHLAARGSVPRSLADPMATNRVNVDGTLNLLEAVRADAPETQLIFSSSSSLYGANPTLPKHEDMTLMPVSPYAVSKLAGEHYMLAYAYSYGLRVLPFRFFNVYGPLQPAGHIYAAAVPVFIDAALNGRPLPIHGDGLQTRDFTYVGTVVSAIGRCIVENIISPVPVNLAFGTRSSLLDVINHIERLLGTPVERHHLPTRAGDVRDSSADNARLRALLPGLEPLAMEEGLAATVAWMRSVHVPT